MPKITLTHDEPYGGFDGDKRLDIKPGDSADVSDAKAKQLLDDFPDRFKKGSARKPKPNGKTDQDPAPYAEFEGDQLRDIATARGLELAADADDDAIRAALIAADEAEAAAGS